MSSSQKPAACPEGSSQPRAGRGAGMRRICAGDAREQAEPTKPPETGRLRAGSWSCWESPGAAPSRLNRLGQSCCSQDLAIATAGVTCGTRNLWDSGWTGLKSPLALWRFTTSSPAAYLCPYFQKELVYVPFLMRKGNIF